MLWKEDSKSFLVFGHQLNQIIAVVKMVSDNYPDVKRLNRLIKN